ncbi:class I SAM-dependent methyltransferase [Nonomuraea purpurea]|uniref:Class I SAM-dependent methyltransferase n=1 Tax=Nonomuraea purpurea TaxID=1849276 RepID=A0ABV8GB92_9ACTN
MHIVSSPISAGRKRAAGVGIEQFHHPRPVGVGGRRRPRPTPERERLVAGLAGRVLELGSGDGVKLACYPPAVEEILLVEPDPFLRAASKAVVADLPATPARLLDGELTRFPAPDASCDAVVCALILCCSGRLAETFAEIRRVLRPGGELRFYEHQRPRSHLVALLSGLVTPLWSRAAGGCHPARDILAAMRRAGFAVESVERFAFRGFDHVVGVARPR